MNPESVRQRFRQTRERIWDRAASVLVWAFWGNRQAASGNKLYTKVRQNKAEVKRFVKFAIVGMTGLVVDYTVLNILAHGYGVGSAMAMAVAFIIAATNNFIWNIAWVYPESRQAFWKHFPTFLIVNTVGLGINELILFLFEMPIERLVGSAFIGLNLTKAIAAIIVMMWNFLINRFVTFRHVKWEKIPAGQLDAQEQFESAL